jgi:hypothetical protein
MEWKLFTGTFRSLPILGVRNGEMNRIKSWILDVPDCTGTMLASHGTKLLMTEIQMFCS